MSCKTTDEVRLFIEEALRQFVKDPPDSDFQQGYLEALYVIGREALGMDLGADPKPEPHVERRPMPILRVVK